VVQRSARALLLRIAPDWGTLTAVGRASYVWVATLGGLACKSAAHAPALPDDSPPAEGGTGATGGGGPGGCVDDASTPPLPDAQGLCGNTFLRATSDPPNVYFVIDRSGSMLETVDGRVKYDAVASASVALVRRLGSQVNVGAAVFPGPLVNADDGCVMGEEVFATRPGDALAKGACDLDGPVTRGFSRSISLPSGSVPLGGTPTAATLARLLPTLATLPGRTAVILATDGGPNCNRAAMCDESKCMPNIEHAPSCTDGVNCCLPSLYGPTSCLDDVATLAALSDLAHRGIKTYVVGIPGSNPYAALLGDMARIGGTARPAASGASYYDVDHLNELDGILSAIGSTVILSCHLHLDMAPKAMSLVNVYLDRQLVEYGGADGWIWTNPGDAGVADGAGAGWSDTSNDVENDDALGFDAPPADDADSPDAVARAARQDLDLLGGACDRLMSGKVRQVQVVFGCPTVTPK
jgi:hypothetical protein